MRIRLRILVRAQNGKDDDMNTYDPRKAERVWARVQGTQVPEHGAQEMNLQGMIMNEWVASSTYLALARQVPPREGCILQRLAREEQCHGACLKGIYTMITDQEPVIKASPMTGGSVEGVLKKCYGAEMQTLKEYERWATDPEYGPVFSKLAEQEREHCRLVLELIGRVGNK